jgi:hypothetical protein
MNPGKVLGKLEKESIACDSCFSSSQGTGRLHLCPLLPAMLKFMDQDGSSCPHESAPDTSRRGDDCV